MIHIEQVKRKNTVLFVEPRNYSEAFVVLDNAYDILQDDWNYVFYCGKSVYNEWKNLMPYYVELRQLHCDNFTSDEYSSFLKEKELWNSLEGDYVLTIQLDTWLINNYPYTIDYYIKQDRSYIGGNMVGTWREFGELGIESPEIRNFNGGLSLRKRMDMIYIIDYFTSINDEKYKGLAEDVYFTVGCILLNLKTGNVEETSQFGIHSIYYDKCFGIHNIWVWSIQEKIKEKYPYLLHINPHVYGSTIYNQCKTCADIVISKRDKPTNTTLYFSQQIQY
jgi:hypothetical protein